MCFECIISEDLFECIISEDLFECIISEDLFESLPMEEKKLWHSHVHEVKSGEPIAPGVPDMAEKEMMKDIIQTLREDLSQWMIRCSWKKNWKGFFNLGKSIEVITFSTCHSWWWSSWKMDNSAKISVVNAMNAKRLLPRRRESNELTLK